MWKWLLFALMFLLLSGVVQAQVSERALLARVWAYDGKIFETTKSPTYVSYDEALRNYMVVRIQREFGVRLDPKQYSGFDLLEIESLFKCKKPTESFDLVLKSFPKRP